MHECPNCGMACDCDVDDLWNGDFEGVCHCDCEDEDDIEDIDGDTYLDGSEWEGW